MLIAGSLLLKCAGHMLPLTHPLNKDTIIQRERERERDHTPPDLYPAHTILPCLFISLSIYRENQITGAAVLYSII